MSSDEQLWRQPFVPRPYYTLSSTRFCQTALLNYKSATSRNISLNFEKAQPWRWKLKHIKTNQRRDSENDILLIRNPRMVTNVPRPMQPTSGRSKRRIHYPGTCPGFLYTVHCIVRRRLTPTLIQN